MNAKADSPADNDRLDTVKWLVAAILLGVGIVGFYYFDTVSTVIRVLVLLLIAGGVVFLLYTTQKGRFAWGFIQEAHLEVRKVVWPSRQETLQTTGIVILMVLVVALMIWLIDSLLFWIVQTLTT